MRRGERPHGRCGDDRQARDGFFDGLSEIQTYAEAGSLFVSAATFAYREFRFAHVLRSREPAATLTASGALHAVCAYQDQITVRPDELPIHCHTFGNCSLSPGPTIHLRNAWLTPRWRSSACAGNS
jgi:hypothetical protein